MEEKKITSTNLGEKENRESMYETAREVLMEGKEVEMNGKTHNSLGRVIMEDFDMEVAKEEKYFQEGKAYLNAQDDIRGLRSLSKAMSRGIVVDALRERLKKANEYIKMLQQYNDYLDEESKFLKADVGEMTIDELNNALRLLREYEKCLMFILNDDIITKKTYSVYTKTKASINEIEKELQYRQASVNL